MKNPFTQRFEALVAVTAIFIGTLVTVIAFYESGGTHKCPEPETQTIYKEKPDYHCDCRAHVR